MLKNQFYRQVAFAIMILMVIIAGCRVTQGYFLIVVAIAGAVFAIQRKTALVMACYVILPFILIVNRRLVSYGSGLSLMSRFGMLLMVGVMLLTSGQMRGRERVPLIGLFAYLMAAVISSIDGWCPIISYLKIFNCLIFFWGLCLAGKLLQDSEQGLRQTRVVFMAFSVIILLGSVVAYFIPSIGYSMFQDSMERYGVYMPGAEIASQEGMVLFNGLTYHSQSLAPIAAMFGSWVLCDMLLIERRISVLHISLLGSLPILLYMSRSRTGFTSLVALMGMALIVVMPMAKLPSKVKGRVMNLFAGMAIILVLAAAVVQIRSQALSRWLRKTDDVRSDGRSLVDAVTASRGGAIEILMRDFKLNPIFGKGFQVMSWHPMALQSGAITYWSAPIEKGVLPLMVLAEGGIFGGFVFLCFLLHFCGRCLSSRYLSLLTLHTVMFTTNLGEASYFSPSGHGGVLWVVAVVGGFCIDMLCKRQAGGGYAWGMPLHTVYAVGYGNPPMSMP